MYICNQCPRKCSVDRSEAVGICGVGQNYKVARAALHYWEEPCISGKKGSGTVFFSGCPLKCVYCQNSSISDGCFGKEISEKRLIEIFKELEAQGANNINLVTPTMYIYQIIEAIKIAKTKGLNIPIIYNSNGYENVETIKKLKVRLC